MASTINASTSGAGGVITTADASGVLQLQTAGTTALTATAAQDLFTGTTDTAGVGGQLDALRVIGTSGGKTSIAQFRYSNDINCPNLRHYKSRSTTIGGFDAVQNGDNLAVFQSYGSDGTAWVNGGYIVVNVDGVVSTGAIPTSVNIVTTNSIGAPTLQAQVKPDGDFLMNSGYGAPATAYGCRAWVNFNGTGTVDIRASGNVSSINDNGVGDYTVNFTTAMPDANYSYGGSAARMATSSLTGAGYTLTANDVVTARTANGFRIIIMVNSGDGAYDIAADSNYVNVNVFR